MHGQQNIKICGLQFIGTLCTTKSDRHGASLAVPELVYGVFLLPLKTCKFMWLMFGTNTKITALKQYIT